MDQSFESTFIGRPETVRVQLSLWRVNIKPHTDVHDSQLNETFIRTLINNWSHLSPGTTQQLVSITSRYILWRTGQKLDCSRINRILDRSRPKTEKTIWNKAQTEKALHFARHTNKWLYQILLTGLHTGARYEELCFLTKNDIDFKDKMIHIRDSKNGQPRKVPMSLSVCAIMAELCATKPEFIFGAKEVNRPLKRLCELAEVPKITFHACRHMFVTRALEAGVSPKKLSKITGHGVRTMVDVYWRLTSEIGTDDIAFLED